MDDATLERELLCMTDAWTDRLMDGFRLRERWLSGSSEPEYHPLEAGEDATASCSAWLMIAASEGTSCPSRRMAGPPQSTNVRPVLLGRHPDGVGLAHVYS